MRAVAMKLHTKEQAPKEGGVEAPKPQRAVRGCLGGGGGHRRITTQRSTVLCVQHRLDLHGRQQLPRQVRHRCRS
jgi:hypothetical protein